MFTGAQLLSDVVQLLGAFVFPLYLGALVLYSRALGWAERVSRWGTPACIEHANDIQESCSSAADGSRLEKVAEGPSPGSAEAGKRSRPVILSVAKDLAPGSPAWQLLEPLVQQYGQGILSQSMLYNPEFHHFYVPSKGSLVFCQVQDYGRCVVAGVGDPLAAPTHWEYLTQAFLAAHPRATFLHASQSYARLLAGQGYLVNELGRETVIQAQTWSYTSRTKTLRRSARQAREAGVRVRELCEADLTPEVLQALERQVTDSWLQQKVVADRHIRIFVRHANYQRLNLQDGTRLFVVEEGGQGAAAGRRTAEGAGGAQSAAPVKPKRRGQTKARAMRQLQQKQQQEQASEQQHMPQQEVMQQRQRQQDTQVELEHQAAPAPATGPVADADVLPVAATTATSRSSSGSSTPDTLLGRCATAGSGNRTCSSCSRASSTSAADMKVLLEEGAASTDGGEGPLTPHGSAHVQLLQLSQLSSKGDDTLVQLMQPDTSLPGTPKPALPAAAAQLDTVKHQDQAAPVVPVLAGEQGTQQQPAHGVQGTVKGFLLLDPLWDAGRVTGYVTAILRTTSDAHPGAIKLLVEETLRVLKGEGKEHLNFGFSPLWNSQDARSQLPGAWWAHWGGKFLYHCGNNLYAFKNLAFSKTRYGGGLTPDGAQFRDSNVLMPPVYVATYSPTPGLAMLDFYILIKYIGFCSGLLDAGAKLLRLWSSKAVCSSP